ncbi:MAG: hypothetical protein SGI86_22860 [Deltaproteobacteria bacterium]|nr:hypothetical protein [Deltaproteobacteria bacterium]
MIRTISVTTLGTVCIFLVSCGSDASTENPLLHDAAVDAAQITDVGTPNEGATTADAGIELTVSDASSVDATVAVISPDAFLQTPGKAYGETCSMDTQCSANLCLRGFGCSRYCEITKPNPCRAEKAFCLPLARDQGFACAGEIDTGNDLDDAIVQVGDRVQRALTPLKDADMFTVGIVRSEPIVVTVSPAAGIDVALDVYNLRGELIATSNLTVGGGMESIYLSTDMINDWAFVVVRNVGNSTGSYQFSIEKQK